MVLANRLISALITAILLPSLISLGSPSMQGGRVYVYISIFMSHMEIYPSGAEANITTSDGVHYYFTGDIYGEIQIMQSNIVIDGRGHRLYGRGDGVGIRVFGGAITLKNTSVSGYKVGLSLESSNDNKIIGNRFEGCGLVVIDSRGNRIMNNTVNGKPLVYLEAVSSATVTDAGEVIVVGSVNVTVKNLSISGSTLGVEFWDVKSSTITGSVFENLSGQAILMISVGHITIEGNKISNTSDEGVLVKYIYGSIVAGNNTLSRCGNAGISIRWEASLESRGFVNITRNNISFIHGVGVVVSDIEENISIYRNIFTGNMFGEVSVRNTGPVVFEENKVVNTMDGHVGIYSAVSSIVPRNNTITNSVTGGKNTGKPKRNTTTYWSSPLLLATILVIIAMIITGVHMKRKKVINQNADKQCKLIH